MRYDATERAPENTTTARNARKQIPDTRVHTSHYTVECTPHEKQQITTDRAPDTGTEWAGVALIYGLFARSQIFLLEKGKYAVSQPSLRHEERPQQQQAGAL